MPNKPENLQQVIVDLENVRHKLREVCIKYDKYTDEAYHVCKHFINKVLTHNIERLKAIKEQQKHFVCQHCVEVPKMRNEDTLFCECGKRNLMAESYASLYYNYKDKIVPEMMDAKLAEIMKALHGLISADDATNSFALGQNNGLFLAIEIVTEAIQKLGGDSNE